MTSFIDETDSRLPADLSPDEKFRFVMTFNGAIDTRHSEHEALNLALESLRTPESRMPPDEEVVSRHHGPGPHPGTGTDQSVHAGGRAQAQAVPDRIDYSYNLERGSRFVTWAVRERGKVEWAESEDRLRAISHAILADVAGLERVDDFAARGWIGKLDPRKHPGITDSTFAFVVYDLSFNRPSAAARGMDKMNEILRSTGLRDADVFAYISYDGGATAQSLTPDMLELIGFRHYGPGDHPGTGTPQQAHAGKRRPSGDLRADASHAFAERYPTVDPKQYAEGFGRSSMWLASDGKIYNTGHHLSALYKIREDIGLEAHPAGMFADDVALHGHQKLGLVRLNRFGSSTFGFQIIATFSHSIVVSRKQVDTLIELALADNRPDARLSLTSWIPDNERRREYEIRKLMERIGEVPGVEIYRHFGPGDHPGTGTPQQAHAGAGAIRGREASPEDFHSAFEAAFRDNKYSAHVTHHSVDDLGTMTALLMTEDGKAGVAVQDHGDGRIEATALFNQGGPPGAGIALLRQAMAEHGVNYVEAFGPYLPKLYETLGFEVAEQFPFDREQAPPDWRYNLYGEPDYFTMRLQ